jgi:hypothetical protein
MCVAGLNVSTQPCNHRWYELRKRCTPSSNLANCPERLRLEGWETRYDHCPWCTDNDDTTSTTTRRLFGSAPSANTTVSSLPTAPELAATRTHRSGSGGTLSSLSRHSSTASVDTDRAQRHRDMNERLHFYLTNHPHDVLPSARKNYPTSVTSPSDESPISDASSVRSASGTISKGLKKSVRFSKAMFKG